MVELMQIWDMGHEAVINTTHTALATEGLLQTLEQTVQQAWHILRRFKME